MINVVRPSRTEWWWVTTVTTPPALTSTPPSSQPRLLQSSRTMRATSPWPREASPPTPPRSASPSPSAPPSSSSTSWSSQRSTIRETGTRWQDPGNYHQECHETEDCVVRYSLSGRSDQSSGHQTPTHPSSLSSSISLSQPRNMSRRASGRTSYGGPGHSTYLPPPQFADAGNSECSDSNFSMMSAGQGITIATLPRRQCHAPSSDTQPLIMTGSSFRTLPRNPPAPDISSHNNYPGPSTGHTDSTPHSAHSQTLPLKSSLKKPSSGGAVISDGFDRGQCGVENIVVGATLEELRVWQRLEAGAGEEIFSPESDNIPQPATSNILPNKQQQQQQHSSSSYECSGSTGFWVMRVSDSHPPVSHPAARNEIKGNKLMRMWHQTILMLTKNIFHNNNPFFPLSCSTVSSRYIGTFRKCQHLITPKALYIWAWLYQD